MTQVLSFTKHNYNMPNDKRAFTSSSINTNRTSHSSISLSNGQVSQKIKNFFRISSGNKEMLGLGRDKDGNNSEKSENSSSGRSKSKTNFFPYIDRIGRNRSQTVASEGDPLEVGMSPAANVNPYFQHQGPPAIRHHDENSVPSSPTGTDHGQEETTADLAAKEELARKLRRVASAPNAQGIFVKQGDAQNIPSTTEIKTMVKAQAMSEPSSAILKVDTDVAPEGGGLLPVPSLLTSPGKLRDVVSFRRTYSSNSIKVRNVEVGPGSFDKIKLIGKGDVGKVYLVREKKSSRLYAMKGKK